MNEERKSSKTSKDPKEKKEETKEQKTGKERPASKLKIDQKEERKESKKAEGSQLKIEKSKEPKDVERKASKVKTEEAKTDKDASHAIGAESLHLLIRSQDYDKLREELTKKKALFKDDAFPHEKHTEYFTQGRLAGKKVEWLRPFDICKEPHFIEGGVTRFDVAQGKLSDCWFIAAVSTMTARKSLFDKVVPLQSFTNDYAGIFRFNFYQYGEWLSVVIDDFLPTVNGSLVLGHSATKNEFWLALLEKAYAKLMGGFETLNFGNAGEAFVDFTGGVAEIFAFNSAADVPPNLYPILYRYYLRNSLVCTYIQRKDGKSEDELTNGLILKHEYALTGMVRVWYKGKIVRLIRLRNPWGKCAWKGPWSADSDEWKSVSAEVKEKVGLKTYDDGEFWIPYKSFIDFFNVFECCHVVNAPNVSSCETYMWNFYEQTGGWLGTTAGGCGNNMESFVNNIMYVLTIVEPDVEDEEGDENNFNTVIISLMQKFFRYRKTIKKQTPIRIGFVIYFIGDLTEADQKKGGSLETAKKDQFTLDGFFKSNHSVGKVDFAEKRGVSGRFQLQPGKYLIVPSTFTAGDEASYILRILVSKSPENRDAYKAKHANHIPVTDFAAKAAVNMPKTRSPGRKSRPSSKKSTGSKKSTKSNKSAKVVMKKPFTPRKETSKVKMAKRAATPGRNEVTKCKKQLPKV